MASGFHFAWDAFARLAGLGVCFPGFLHDEMASPIVGTLENSGPCLGVTRHDEQRHPGLFMVLCQKEKECVCEICPSTSIAQNLALVSMLERSSRFGGAELDSQTNLAGSGQATAGQDV